VVHHFSVIATQSIRLRAGIISTFIVIIANNGSTQTNAFSTHVIHRARKTVVTWSVINLGLRQASVSSNITKDVFTLSLRVAATISVSFTGRSYSTTIINQSITIVIETIIADLSDR
jgi:hypothetical protein